MLCTNAAFSSSPKLLSLLQLNMLKLMIVLLAITLIFGVNMDDRIIMPDEYEQLKAAQQKNTTHTNTTASTVDLESRFLVNSMTCQLGYRNFNGKCRRTISKNKRK